MELLLLLLVVALLAVTAQGVILTPPYFNLAAGRRIYATATCGEEIQEPELYCKLVGANADRDVNVNLIQGQVCDYCDPSQPDKKHPPEFAVDGAETWWQSPPLSRGVKYNEVNLTIDLGQEFHVAYVFIKMANSPRPGVWVLEKSVDNGVTYQPWQYFADTPGDCETYFGRESLQPITRDNSVVCETQYSKVVPLEGGEIVVSLLNNRPSANDFFNSTVLQEWTQATNVRLRFLRTKTLLGHLMSVARQDPTVTRRYFYSIKDISIGGRCMCNGHADTCDITDPNDPYKLLCRCQHHTCGGNCDTCCPGYRQKAWRQSKSYEPFVCEPCNCFGHADECTYDPDVDREHHSLDIHGYYEGGGVCQNCRDNTEGINCDRCKPGYYRPFGKNLNETDVCHPCRCDYFYSTGNCEEGTGRCECRVEFTPPYCDSCSFGYFGYPECRPCECHLNGTRGFHCESSGGQCPCKPNYAGRFCNKCYDGYYKFPECLSCDCSEQGSLSNVCDVEAGQCSCKSNYGGRTCDICGNGYYNYPECLYCNCDVKGTLPGVCDKSTGQCLCKEGYTGERCDRCTAGYHGYPDCRPCNCSEVGSSSTICDASGKCTCLYNFAGRTCDQCSPGYYQYPECLPCKCEDIGSIGVSCDGEGRCQCKDNFDGNRCEKCKEGFYNYPICEECNCDPAGVPATFTGCGTLPPGELCKCKDRVHGRICNECRPLFWNLQATNPDGCEECDCYIPGVMGGLGVCDTKTGQCMCKPLVTSRRCDTCNPGTYSLAETNLFGCSDCGCDVGGSVNNICDKETGQCTCRPRINGRTCKEPLQTHYFPTLYQYQYEAEDGHTPASTPARYGFNESIFRNYSWKGYAVFSQLQNEIIQDVYITKPSLYRMVLRYKNPNPETILGSITITPDNPTDIEQNFLVQFKPSHEPTFTTVSGPSGSIPSPLVMNPGHWSVSIKNEKSLFLDYFVLLPAAFYEATVLVDQVYAPCEVGNKGLCRHFSYPDLTQFDMVRGGGGYRIVNKEREPLDVFFRDEQHLRELNTSDLPLLNKDQPEIYLDLRVSKPGRHVLLLNYLTPVDNNHSTTTVHIETRTQRGRDRGRATLYACPYTSLCRQAVTDRQGRIAVFKFDSNFINPVLKGENNSNVGIDSLVAIPYDQWSLDYQHPKPACIRKDGKCIQALFLTPPDSKKVEFEYGNEQQLAKVLPGVYDNITGLVYLDQTDSMIDVNGKVPHPGQYVFVVHYYQPNHPDFDMEVLVHNGQFYEAQLPVPHCPSNSGCRSIVKQADGNSYFQLTENFVFTLKEASHKGVWLDYVLVIPAEQYSENVLSEEPVDNTGTFIKECGHNHFFMDNFTEGFCNDAVFSLTADYNNGALPCHCDFDGSLSFECEKYGGQCPCKPNVIGRRCEACRTGFYGFPDCRPCDCPSTALCDTYTGECICPRRVTGEKCDQCIAYTYGFDRIIGCEECNCVPLGVARGNLQCDLLNGSCECKPNVMGRTCDRCVAGHHSFPYCQQCDCDLRGTTLDICDQFSAECYCKANVEGQACDLCKEGTFNIQEDNPDGCTKCFCSGRTTRCSSSQLYRAQVVDMQDWGLAVADIDKTVNIGHLVSEPEQLDSGHSIGVDLTTDDTHQRVVYFSAPPAYLGNKLVAYGGALNYTIFYTTGLFGSALSQPDVMLYSGDLYLLHFALEQPAATTRYMASVEVKETNFLLPTGFPATREQLMQVLQRLQAIYIRATYWEGSITSRLGNVSLDVALEGYNPNTSKAMAVEQCQCPQPYKGLSCEECAPGYYRSQTGPYGGYCVPCQCNGHSDTCDEVTGICHDCKHSTTGDHCELCAVGYHGDATQGSPFDCLICACPLPITSNNFATSCDLSDDGARISCECRPGYYGARCQSCAAGFYGRPEIPGDYCRPCECSGNINPDDPGSCDSVSGECLRCLNNTFGMACNLCAPGYFGDAVHLKDCQTCDCSTCGTRECDSHTGQCLCHDNVVGEKCDRCQAEHYGFNSCQGCLACNCQIASESSQCDDTTGQCRCKPGVTGRTCERCQAGFWNYSGNGCVSCGCNTDYSLGFGCNPNTGQCECLPGVIGEKCDHCPYRWVLKEEEGCFECDSCIHNLLDVTDQLRSRIDPVAIEFELSAAPHARRGFHGSVEVGSSLQRYGVIKMTIAVGYFTHQRLVYINSTASELAPKVKLLDPLLVDLRPITQELESLEQDAKNLNRKANYLVESGQQVPEDGDAVRLSALEVEELVKNTVTGALQIVSDVGTLAFSLEASTSPQIDAALQEAQAILEEIQQQDFSARRTEAEAELNKANALLFKMDDFSVPVRNQSKAFEALRAKIQDFDDKLNDLHNHTVNAVNKASDAQALNDANNNSKVVSTVEKVKNLTQEANSTLEDANELLRNASALLGDAREAFENLLLEAQQGQDSRDRLNETLVTNQLELYEVQQPVRKAEEHALKLEAKAKELEDLFNEANTSSGNAIDAANAYSNIEAAIHEAHVAAEDAGNAAENATDLSQGLDERTGESGARSSELLQNARGTLDQAQQELLPHLGRARSSVEEVRQMNLKNDEGDSRINRALQRTAYESQAPEARVAMNQSDAADQIAQSALNSIEHILHDLPEQVDQSRKLPRDVEDTSKVTSQANNNLQRVQSVKPDIDQLIDQLSTQRTGLDASGSDLKAQIEDLRQKISLARDVANRIKVGVTFSQNTALELRNPESLPQLATSTKVSLYFKTNKPNGFLLYLGNEEGTHRKMRRVRSDDFLALQIENGYPILTIDLGSGAQKIISDKFVSDDVWYQAIIERTGKKVQLIIREEVADGQEKKHVNELVLSGTFSIFNLDQELSKLFVGGFPVYFGMQPEIKYQAFEGQIEELVIGDTPVSLWNFVAAENNVGAIERDKLVNLQPSTGYRFDGSGYAAVNSRPYRMRERSDVQLKFKTRARDGLLFLAGKGHTFLSVELRDGNVLYQYDLGGGLLQITSQKAYNDDKWHTVEAVREKEKGVLRIDGVPEFQGSAPERATQLQVSEHFHVGGYPGQLPFRTVTGVGFEGCIDGVQIDGTPVDLSQNVEAFGVTPGCPVQFASSVAFDAANPGYVHWPNGSAVNFLQLNLKFKTAASSGLLFYGSDRHGSAAVSLALLDGSLVMRSQGEELVTVANTHYDDNQWHVVTATHDSTGLRLDIDDFDTVMTDSEPAPLHFLYGSYYFGGLPSGQTAFPGTVATDSPFIGCIGDATVNGMFINFANVTDRSGAILGKCPSADQPFVGPSRPPAPTIPKEDDLPIVPEPQPSPSVPEEPVTSLKPVPTEEPEVEKPEEETTPTPTVPTPAPTPAGKCLLPLEPINDTDVSSASGYRFGTAAGSRQEYAANSGRIKMKYEFSLEFRTFAEDGIMLYVADDRHIDFIALYMKDGKVYYGFNCGSGSSLIVSEKTYHDGQWHLVAFSRLHTNGRLIIDSEIAGEGSSKGATKSINILSPYYVGGISPNISSDAKVNIKNINGSFVGCLRNFQLNSKNVGDLRHSVGVIPCSDKVERGVFFPHTGGHIVAHPSFRVGVVIDIKLDIRPRKTSGVLLSVHGRRDFLLLQMVNGVLKFSVDNGKGAISAQYTPPHEHYFCDGHWHTIQAVKSKNVVTLSVDKTSVEPGIGIPGSSSTDTRDSLIIGDFNRTLLPRRLRGLETREFYVGCIRNIFINEDEQKLDALQTRGNVMVSVCPTT